MGIWNFLDRMNRINRMKKAEAGATLFSILLIL